MFGKLLATSVLGALAVATFASCGGGTKPLDCSTVKTPKKYSEIAPIIAKCTNCHSSTRITDAQRHGATAGYDYDTFAKAAAAAMLGGADVGGDGDNIMPPVGQNCPSTSTTKCVTDTGAVPDLSDQERLDFQSFACMPTE